MITRSYYIHSFESKLLELSRLNSADTLKCYLSSVIRNELLADWVQFPVAFSVTSKPPAK
jgi:hypothetical protein